MDWVTDFSGPSPCAVPDAMVPAWIGATLAGVPGVVEAWIFGSFAARAAGIPGRVPADVDVLVVGDAALLAVARACVDVGAAVGREVNPVLVTEHSWQVAPDAFLAGLRCGPLLRLALPAGAPLPPEPPPVASDWAEQLLRN